MDSCHWVMCLMCLYRIARSMKQLKREIKANLQAKAEAQKKSIKGLGQEDEMQEAPYNKVRGRHRNARAD